MKDIKSKAIDGVIWNLLEQGGGHVLKLVLGVILARLLTPSDYGLIGMISVFFALSMVLIDSGFGLAYIQKKDADDKDASTIFYFNLFISFIFYFLLWTSSDYISKFYEEPILKDLIRVMGLVVIINSLGLIHLSKLKRNIEFKLRTILILCSSALASLSGIIAALNGLGVWSLVLQEIIRALIMTLGLWVFYKWRPKIIFDINVLKEMFKFSSWALLFSITTKLFDNLNTIVIGKSFPVAQLGFYSKAYSFKDMITKTPSLAFGTVSFPVMSRMQDDLRLLHKTIQKFIKNSLILVTPLCAFFIVAAKPFFIILLTEKWIQIVPYFQLLLVSSIFFPINMINTHLLTAQGKIKLNYLLLLLKISIRVINLLLMYKHGIIYIIYGEIIVSFLELFISSYYSKKILSYGFFEQIKDSLVIILPGILLCVLGLFTIEMISNNYIKLLFSVVLVLGGYVLLTYFFNRNMFNELMFIFREKVILKFNKLF